jgi:hypothetical protein
MESFQEPYWSRLQVELWVCTRSREAVGLAEYAPGRTRFADLSIGPDGLDDEAYDQDTQMFDDEIDLIGTAIFDYGCVCQFEDAQKEVIVALSKGQLQEHQDRSSGVEFFEREEVLRLWPEPRWEILRAKTEPLTLAEAVALLVRGRPASKDVWKRLRRRAGGRFPPAAVQQIEAAGKAIVGMIRNGIVEAFGFRCHGDGGIGSLNLSADDKERLYDDQAFLAHQLWVDPCADAIWTEPDLGDGHFNPTDRCYRYVCLNRTQFLEDIRSHRTKAEAEGKLAGKQHFRRSGGPRKQMLEPATVLPLPIASVSSGSKAEVRSESLSAAADCAEAPSIAVRGSYVPAAIPPAPKRGPRPKYQWPMVHELLDELISRKSGNITQAEATKAILEWCAMQWGGEDGPGEPSEPMVRKHVAAHPGAPWAVIRTKIPTLGELRKPTAMTKRQLSVIEALRVEASSTKKWTFSTKEFNAVCDRSGVIDPSAPSSSQRRVKSDLKRQLTNKGLITGDRQTIRLISLS